MSENYEKDFDKWLLKELMVAYTEARKGKRKTNNEHAFELNMLENIISIRDAIVERRYKPGKGIAFITYDPVTREIFAAPFRDRVVHHFLYNQVYDWWDRRFIYDSYSCRKNKGTLFGIRRLAKHMRSVSENFTKETIVYKMDISGYFMSLPRDGLYKQALRGLKLQFPEGGKLYETLRYLWRVVIYDDPTVNVQVRGKKEEWRNLPAGKSLFCQPAGKGIVIGNLSSQLLSNIYLDKLDRYVTMELGYKAYGRYVDDFFFLTQAKDKERALRDIKKIERYLWEELGLKMHPKKKYIQNINKGVPFLGVVVYPHRIVPGKRVKRNYYATARAVASGQKDIGALVSYMGMMKHINGRQLSKRVFESEGWEYVD